MIVHILSKLRGFFRAETGSAAIEFVLLMPVFFLLVTNSWESGLLSTRQVMLERGVDMTVREIRIGRIANPTHAIISRTICENARIIPDCNQRIKVEMVRRDPRSWSALDAAADCVDLSNLGRPLRAFEVGGNNELMIIRACILFDPLIPTNGLGRDIPKQSQGKYALVASSAYVLEPFKVTGTRTGAGS